MVTIKHFLALTLLLSLSGCFNNEGASSGTTASNSALDSNSGTVAQTDGDSANSNSITASDATSSAMAFGTLTDITSDGAANDAAYIPPQCYTNPVTAEGTETNPCYVCHTESKKPNFLNDFDVQSAYSFPRGAQKNLWANVFKDRTSEIAEISDADILSYVREDNYLSPEGEIILAAKLSRIPAEWDRDGDGQWGGYVPDVWFNFDEQGFDKTPNGEFSGWRVFAYYPFPGTFMPTNGSTDDVMIRLPEAFRQTVSGQFDLEIYKVNFAIVEAMMKQQNVQIDAVDETRLGVDLDNNGELSTATQVTYDWAPRNGRKMYYVGAAKDLLADGDVHIAARLMPEGTEFLHSVRYLDVNEGTGTTGMAKRMKELRYSRKMGWRTYYDWRAMVEKEIKERYDFPFRTKTVFGNMEAGVHSTQGWLYQGFIEDDAGHLRPQSFEENKFCLGCHGYIGASTDTVLSFTRKFDVETGFRQGWYHWFDKSLSGVPDPAREDGQGEFSFYLAHNPTGNEYRTNTEVYNRFHHADGSRNAEAFDKLSQDISYLLMPTPERALLLNKAYQTIVREQSFVLGREAVLTPLTNVHEQVEVDQETGIKTVLSHY